MAAHDPAKRGLPAAGESPANIYLAKRFDAWSSRPTGNGRAAFALSAAPEPG
jgi:hypothetical protein